MTGVTRGCTRGGGAASGGNTGPFRQPLPLGQPGVEVRHLLVPLRGRGPRAPTSRRWPFDERDHCARRHSPWSARRPARGACPGALVPSRLAVPGRRILNPDQCAEALGAWAGDVGRGPGQAQSWMKVTLETEVGRVLRPGQDAAGDTDGWASPVGATGLSDSRKELGGHGRAEVQAFPERAEGTLGATQGACSRPHCRVAAAGPGPERGKGTPARPCPDPRARLGVKREGGGQGAKGPKPPPQTEPRMQGRCCRWGQGQAPSIPGEGPREQQQA